MIAMKYRSPTYSRPFLSDPLLSVCVLSALKLFPVHVSHVLCQLLHLPADSSCMAGKIQNIKSTGLIDPIILLVSWQTTFTVRQTVLSTGRHTDDIQSIVQIWQTTFTVQHTVLWTDRQPDDIQSRVQLWQTTFTVYDKQYWVQIGNQMIYRV